MADEDLRRLFTSNLNHYLALNGFSQADLARKMKVSTATAAKWCTGKAMPRIDKVQSICNWLGLEKSDLLESRIQTDENYYLNKDAREYAEFLHRNPEYRVLFDASRNVKKEDVDFVRQMLDRFGGHDNGTTND